MGGHPLSPGLHTPTFRKRRPPGCSKVAKNFEPGDHQREISDIRIKTGGGLVARSLLGMGWSLTRTPAKLEACGIDRVGDA